MRHKKTIFISFIVQGITAATAVAIVTAILYQFPVRLFFDSNLHDVRPYGLAYITIIALLTWRGGRRLGYFTLSMAVLGALLLLPPRATLSIGDARGWWELSLLIFLSILTILIIKRKEGTLRRTALFLYCLYALPDRLFHRPEVLLVFSHMRSGSSLLTHLLFNHPEICGYGENHLNYSKPGDLDALTGKVMLVRRRWPGTLRERYIMDKVLHNAHLDLSTLAPFLRGRVRVIFLVREPCASISSMIKTFGDEEWWACNYYVDRLTFLARTAEALGDWEGKYKPVFLNYEELLHQTEAAFALMEDQLDLPQPLQQHYKTIPETGKAMIGDTSTNIRSGTIVRDRPAPKELAAETVARSEEAYRQCLKTLTRCCRTVSSADDAF